MGYRLEHVSGPATEPVSLAEVKAHLLIEDLTLTAAQTADLESKVSAARREAEAYLNRKIGTQTWRVILGEWPHWWAEIPVGPLISIEGITYRDEDGNVSTLDPDWYDFASRGIWWLKSGFTWPNVTLRLWEPVTITVTVGIQPEADGGSPESYRYPDNIRQAILMRVGSLWNIREEMLTGTTLQAGKTGVFEALLGGERVIVP